VACVGTARAHYQHAPQDTLYFISPASLARLPVTGFLCSNEGLSSLTAFYKQPASPGAGNEGLLQAFMSGISAAGAFSIQAYSPAMPAVCTQAS
jgi:hypothetical protein